MAENEINRYNPASPTTYEETKKQGELAAEENYTASTLPETTTPVVPDYRYGEGQFNTEFPDYATRLESAKYEEPYIAREISNSYAETLARNSYVGMTPSAPPFDPFGPQVNIRESHKMGNDGVWRTKYPNYYPGINNEDYYARRQSTSDKFWNGVGKFAMKSGLYGLSGIITLPDKLMTFAREGSFKAAMNTDLDKMVNDLDTQIDMLLPHYYRKETEDYNIGQKLTNDTANFLWNDVLGDGMSFTVGAMISAYATGGLGVASLGRVGAKIGGRIGARMAARKAASAGMGNLKGIFNGYVRKGVHVGRNIGDAAKNMTLLATSAGFESSIESSTFMKQSEDDFKNYYRNIYGKTPTSQELAEFRNSNASVGSAIFAANMGILSVSNWLLFGRYIGVGGKMIPNIEKKLNKSIFGLVTEVAKPGEMAIKITNPNIAQKIAANTFNIMKRPASEGLWEEGTQGVVQNTAEEYVKSRYDEVAMNGAVDVLDAIADGFNKQYTSKEGWTEIGIGAIIGSLFGARHGFGATEYRNQRRQLQGLVDSYNKATSNLNTAALNTLKRSMSLGPQVRADGNMMTSREIDDAMFEKMSVDNQLDVLDDSAENFRQMVDMIPLSEIATANGMSIEEAKQYKEAIIENYNERLDDFRAAQGFADDLIGDESKVEFKKYVARNAFLGLQAEKRMHYLSSKIEDVSGEPDVAEALNIFSQLSGDARYAASELHDLGSKIREIESEIEDVATRPRNVNGVDPEAEEIQRKTKELENLRKEYNQKMRELSTLIGKEFSVSELIGAKWDVLDDPLSAVTPEQVTHAYESLIAFDDYFNVKSRRNSEFTAKDKAIRHLVDEYRRNLIDYRNMNNFLAKTLDGRFLAEEEKGFARALSSLFETKYEGDDTLPYFMESGAVGEYTTDDVVDQALDEGRITKDEAWTIKAFMHSMDRMREQKRKGDMDDISQMPITETVSDEDYESALEDPTYVPEVRGSIIDKLYTGNEDLLTGREREIYEKFKQDFDDYIKSLGDNPENLIKSLQEEADALSEEKDTYATNKYIIDLVRKRLSPEDLAAFDEAVRRYVDLMGRKERGEQIDDDALIDAMITIERLGGIGNIQSVLPFIEQNRVISGGNNTAPTTSNFGSRKEDVETLTNETDEKDKTPGSNIDSAQNPEILTVRIISTKEGQVHEVSGLRADKFLSMVKTSVPMSVTEETLPNGKKKYTIVLNGETAVITELPYHARWTMDDNSVRIFNEYTDLSIQDVSTAYSAAYRRLDDGTMTPYRTGVGFGVNETDKIDQEALAETKKGDEVQLVIDVNDSYNQSLINEYNDAVQSGEKDRIERAEKALVTNMVIKVMRDGKFISVVKADFGGVSGIEEIRREAFNKWKKDAGKSSVIEVGTRKVVQTLPGRPVFNMSTSPTGAGVVENLPITEKGSENIVDVGYMLNGKLHLKENTRCTAFPFATSIMSDKLKIYKNHRIPVVVVKGKNGLHYVYPVALRESESQLGKSWISFIDMLLNNAGDTALLQSVQGDIADLNTYLMTLGLDPAEYQVSYLNPIQGLLKARDAIEKYSVIPDVEKWLINDGRSVKDIVTSEVEAGIDFEGEMFVAPKIRIQFSNAKSNKESKKEDEEPFNSKGGPTVSPKKPDPTAPSGGTATPGSTPKTGTGTPGTSTPGTTTTVSEKTSGKRFSSKLEDIEKHVKDKGLPLFANIYDFIARKIVGGEIRFLREKSSPDDLRAVMGIDINGTVGNRLSTTRDKGGMTMEDYVKYLRDSKDQVVMDYVSTRTDEQIIAELKSFLGYIKFKPSAALNYSLRVNGMDTIKEYGSEEEVKEMEANINSIVSEEVPSEEEVTEGVTEAIVAGGTSSIPSSLEYAGMTEEEKKQYLDDLSEQLASSKGGEAASEEVDKESKKIENGEKNSKGSGTVRAEENGTAPVAGEEQGQPGNGVQTEGNAKLPGPEGGRVDEEVGIYEDDSEVVDTVQVKRFMYGGDEAYVGVPGKVEPIPDDMMQRNMIEYGDKVSSPLIRGNGFKRHGNFIYKFYKGNGLYDVYNVNTGEAFRIKPDKSLIDVFNYIYTHKRNIKGAISRNRSSIESGNNERYILEEKVGLSDRVQAKWFIYGGDEAYANVEGEVEPIPYDVIQLSGIRYGTHVSNVRKLGYNWTGVGDWWYRRNEDSGSFDMYNISTGEALRIKSKEDIYDVSSSLKQTGRNIQNLRRSGSREESSRNKSLVDKSNNADSRNQLNTKCN